jgi:hypothetical protein
MESDELTWWLDGLDTRIARLHDDLLVSVPLDYSVLSLRMVESTVGVQFQGNPDEVRTAENEDYTLRVAAYVGETLRRVVRGSWVWNDDPESGTFNLPLVLPAEELGLPPMSPVHLIELAVLIDDARQFTEQHTMWAQAPPSQPLVKAADGHRIEYPPVLASWLTKQQNSFDDWAVVQARAADPHRDEYPPTLASWLTKREDDFPTWVVTYAPGEGLDFTPRSLPALESVLREWAALGRPLTEDLPHGAEWYLGEVVRRGHGGRWRDTLGVRRVEVAAGVDFVPADTLRRALDEPGYLRAAYDQLGEVDHIH